MPCAFSKPLSGGATPSLAVCTFEANGNTFDLSSPSPNVADQQQMPPGTLAARISVLFPLFRRCCPRKTLKRLLTAGSALVLCSSCNLMTPTLLGVAVDAAAASHQKAGTAAAAAATITTAGAAAAADSGTVTATLAKAATDAAAAATRITAAGGNASSSGGLLKEVWHALCLFFSGGGRAALQQQPPRVLFALVCGVVLLGAAMSWLRTTQLESAEQEIRAEVRRQLFSALLYAPPSFLFYHRNLGLLLPLFREDTDTLVAAFSSSQAQALRYCSSAFGGSALLLLLSPRLTAVALVLLPLAGCSAMLLAKRQRALQRERDAVWQQCNALLADRLLHMPTVYIHQEQQQEEYRFEQQQLQLLKTARRAAFANGLFYGGLSFLVNSTVVALLVLGTKLVASGVMTQGSLTTFAVYSSMVGVGCSGLAALSGDISRAAAAGARINAIFTAAGAAAAAGTAAAAGVGGPPAAAKATKKGAVGKEEKMGLQHSAADNEKDEKEKEEKKQQHQRDASEAAAAAHIPSVLQQLLQQHEQGHLTAAEVATRMRGEIQFHNVSYLYQREFVSGAAAAAAAVVGSIPASQSRGGTLPAGSGGDALAQDQQQRNGRGGTGGSAEAEEKNEEKEREKEEEDQGGGVRNISMVIAAGSITGIAGASGSGKSTLLKLLTKQLKPQTGKITLDGVDIQEIPTQVLLQQLLGVVSADSVAWLAGLTVRENVLYGVWTPPPSQQQSSSSGSKIPYVPSGGQHAELSPHSHAAAANAAAATGPAAHSGGCPFLRAKAAATQMICSRFFPITAAAPTAAPSPASTTPSAAAASSSVASSDASAAAAAAEWSQQQQQQELLFREACRLCSVSEFLQQQLRCPSGVAAAAPSPSPAAAACPHQSLASSSPSSSSREKRIHDAGTSSRSSEDTIAATALSSGELQRLGIARAIVKRPAVLLLDEATAHLDERNERLLLTTLRKLVSGKKKAGQMQQTPSNSSSSNSSSGNKNDRGNSSGDKRISSKTWGGQGTKERAAADNEETGEVSSRERQQSPSPVEATTRTATPASDSASSPGSRGHEDCPSRRAAASAAATATAGREKKGREEVEEQQGEEKQQDQRGASLLLKEGVRTVLLIAHSKQALKLADKVIVLRKGCIVEEGAYDELLQRKEGELVRLVHQQDEAEAAEELLEDKTETE